MAERDKPHLFIREPANAAPYRPPPREIETPPLPAPDDRRQHGQRLRDDLQQAEADAVERRRDRPVSVEGAVEGIYATFESFPGIDLALKSLDPQQGRTHPELVSVQTIDVGGATVERATVFIPHGKINYFLKRITQYLDTAHTDNPRNRKLIDTIQSIRAASIEALWTDPPQEFPRTGQTVWWEVWLRRRDGRETERLRAFAGATGLRVGRQSLGFGDRMVVLLQATVEQLGTAVDVLDDLAELRRPHDPTQFLAGHDAVEQAEWIAELVGSCGAGSRARASGLRGR